ncbi:polyketide synthase dehydratase domain-containing protein, partial [Streptomyces pharetrae]|uniref:polyketide synthase dehydratase domain-containing protein n=1 Tax=Streptomyces pharetrae TaxID=291370 RepID=UPI0036C8351D
MLFPAAGYLEMAVQAVRALTGGTDAALGDIELRKALFLPDGESRAVQLTLSAEHGGFTVATRAADAAEPTVHAVGSVRPRQRRRPGRALDAAAVRDRCGRHLSGPDCYAALASLGYRYGPAFQGIDEVWVGSREALARVRPTAAVAGQAAGHHVHPVVLDSFFQTLLTTGLREDAPAGTGIRLPVAIAEVRLEHVGDRPVWVHATVTGNGAELVGDIGVYDEDGTPLGEVTGFRAADVERAAASVGLTTIDGWLTETTWRELPEAPEPPDGHPGQWLLFADGGGVAEALAERITARGGGCQSVRPGTGYRPAADGRPAAVEPGSADDLARLLADRRAAGAPDPTVVVHLLNLDRPELAGADRTVVVGHTGPGGHS